MAASLSCDSYTIGWVAALACELGAAKVMLDEKHQPPGDFQKHESDENNYTWGRIGRHNVVLCSLPYKQIGLASASQTVSGLRASLPNIRIGLLVGIAAGVAKESVVGSVITVGRDIRLGDVVVSAAEDRTSGIVQYDLFKSKMVNGQKINERTGFLGAPPRCLSNALSSLDADYKIGEGGHEMLLDAFESNPTRRKNYGYPGADRDRFNGALGARAAADPDRPRSLVHFGIIASGNTLFRDATSRDAVLADLEREGIHPMCLEMEAAGIMNNFPCIVIRGISDYGDGSKDNTWHGFASATAAAFAKELLGYLDQQSVERETPLGKIVSNLIEVKADLHDVKKYTDENRLRSQGKEAEKICDWICPPETFQPPSVDPDIDVTFVHDDVKYMQWLEEAHENAWHLNCYGDMGVGKTVRAQAVASHLRAVHKSSDDTVIIEIFIRPSHTDPFSVKLFLRGILRQAIAFVQQELSHEIIHAWREARTVRDGRYSLTHEQSRSQLREILRQYRRKFLVVDALEYAEHCRDELFEELGWLHKQGVAIFTTELSRAYKDIVYCNRCPRNMFEHNLDTYWCCKICRDFDLCEECYIRNNRCETCSEPERNHPDSTMTLQLRPRVNMKMEAAADEVQAFVMSTLNRHSRMPGFSDGDERLYEKDEPVLVKIRKKLDDHDWSKTAECVCDVAEGSFLFAKHFTLSLCRKAGFQEALSMVKQLHEGVVSEMDKLYDERLKYCVDNQYNLSMARLARSWLIRVLAARHSLTFEQLQHAVAVDDETFTKEDLKSRCSNQTEVLRAARGLLAMDVFGENNSPCVRFSHVSLLQHMRAVQNTQFEDAHAEMLRSCLLYIGLDAFQDPFSTSADIQSVIREYPFAPYAALYWAEHAKQTKNTEYKDMILSLLRDEPRLRCVMQLAWRARSRERRTDGWDVDNGITGLHVCAFYGLAEPCLTLLQEGYDVEALEEGFLRSPLSYACRNGHHSIVRLLLKHEADINHVALDGKTPLIEAIEGGHLDICDLLMNHEGLDINRHGNVRSAVPALVAASRSGQVILIRKLLRRPDLDVNAVDDIGCTALSWAVRKLQGECVRHLLRDGRTMPLIRDKFGARTSLDWIVEDSCPGFGDFPPGRLDIATMLIEDQRNLVPSNTTITKAIAGKHIKLLKILTPNGLDLSYTDEHGRGFLHHAALHGVLEVVQLICDTFAEQHEYDIDQQDNYGASALHTACSEATHSFQLIGFLLDRGADPLLKDRQGLTPCQRACSASPKIWHAQLKALFKKYVPPTLQGEVDVAIQQTITSAIETRDPDALKAVLSTSTDRDLDPERDFYTGSHILHRAVSITSETLRFTFLDALIPRSAHFINRTNHVGRTCTHHLATQPVDPSTFARLINAPGIDLNVRDQWDMTPFELAQTPTEHCYEQCVQLVAAGAELPRGEHIKPEVLEAAIAGGDARVVRRLVSAGVTLRRRNSQWDETVLQQAEYALHKTKDEVHRELRQRRSWFGLDEAVAEDERVVRRWEVVEVLQRALEDTNARKEGEEKSVGSRKRGVEVEGTQDGKRRRTD